jgi:hypothetical protein
MLRHDPAPVADTQARHPASALGTVLAELSEGVAQEAVMGTVAEFRTLGNEGPSTAYTNGVADGQSARVQGSMLTLSLQVGIDDYARGFRAGFFRQLSLATGVDEG